MSTTTEYITVTERAIVTKQLPRTIFNLTDPQLIEDCARHYYRIAHNAMEFNGHVFPRQTLTDIVACMADGGAVTVLYRNEKGEISARTIFPHSVHLTKDNHVTTYGYCTYRKECRSFRLDMMDCVQVVTTPAEAAEAVAA